MEFDGPGNDVVTVYNDGAISYRDPLFRTFRARDLRRRTHRFVESVPSRELQRTAGRGAAERMGDGPGHHAACGPVSIRHGRRRGGAGASGSAHAGAAAPDVVAHAFSADGGATSEDCDSAVALRGREARRVSQSQVRGVASTSERLASRRAGPRGTRARRFSRSASRAARTTEVPGTRIRAPASTSKRETGCTASRSSHALPTTRVAARSRGSPCWKSTTLTRRYG